MREGLETARLASWLANRHSRSSRHSGRSGVPRCSLLRRRCARRRGSSRPRSWKPGNGSFATTTRPPPQSSAGPRSVRSCVFELDGVLVNSTPLHVEAWSRTFGELLASRVETPYGQLVAPFDPQIDYPQHIEGRPRLEGVRAFLASRGMRLPEGRPGDRPGAPTVYGVANRKNELVGLLLEQHGVTAFDGVRHYLELAHDAGIGCAVVSASAH